MKSNVFDLVESHTMHLDLSYSKNIDWWLRVYKKGCGKNGRDIMICEIQDCDLSYVLDKGSVMVKEWLVEHKGGY